MTVTTHKPAGAESAPQADHVAPARPGSAMLRRVGLPLVGYGFLLAVWSFCSLVLFTEYVLPAPWTVGAEMWHLAADGTAFVNSAPASSRSRSGSRSARCSVFRWDC